MPQKVVLIILTVLLADCWLGVYLDWRVQHVPRGIAIVPPADFPPARPGEADVMFFRAGGTLVYEQHADGSVTIPDGTFGPDDVVLQRDAATELKPVKQSGNVRSCGVVTTNGPHGWLTTEVPCDGKDIVLGEDTPNTLALRGGDPKQWRVYATFTDSRQSGFFKSTGYLWRFVWNGHNTPLIAPSFTPKI